MGLLPAVVGALPRALAGLVMVLVVMVGSAGAPAAAAPDPDDPRRASEVMRPEVERLRADVTRLETEAGTAVESYNTARSDLQAAILAELRAEATLDIAQRESREVRADAERRIRTVYRTGPGADTVLVLLGGYTAAEPGHARDDLGDVAVTLRTTRALLAADVRVTASARTALDAAVSSSSTVLDQRANRVRAQAAARDRSEDVEAVLARQRSLLAEADARLLATVERERREAEAIALAWAVSERAEAVAVAAAATSGAAPGVRPGATPTVATPEATATFLARAAATTPDPVAAAAITAATTRLGLPYTWGATGPSTFDCSGLTQWAYAQAGQRIPRTSRQQYGELALVDPADLQPGDLVFYGSDDTPGSIHHVGLYVGDGLMIHAPRTGDVVTIGAVDRMPLFGAVRPTAASA